MKRQMSHRYARYSLRSLLVAFSLVAVPLTLVGNRCSQLHQEDEARKILERSGVVVRTRRPRGLDVVASRMTGYSGHVRYVSAGVFVKQKLSLDEICAIRAFRRIERLDLVDSGCSDVVLERLASSGKLFQLHSIRIEGDQISGAGIVRIVRVAPALEDLSVTGVKLDDESLREIIRVKSLKRLEITGSHVSKPSIDSLFAASHIRQLILHESTIGMEDARSYCERSAMSYVTLVNGRDSIELVRGEDGRWVASSLTGELDDSGQHKRECVDDRTKCSSANAAGRDDGRMTEEAMNAGSTRTSHRSKVP